MNTRKLRDIFNLQPLQISTAELIPNSTIPGIVKTPVDVVGSGVAAKVVASANGLTNLLDGIHRIVVTVVGATGTGKFKVVNAVTGMETIEITTSATANGSIIPGVDLTVADTTGLTVGHYCEMEIIGDSTYIIPGTVLGRIKTGTFSGKWRPVKNDADMSNFDVYRIASGFQETDKQALTLKHGYEQNISQVYTIEVVNFAEVYEAACKAINLTDAIKAKLNGIVWL